MKMLLKKNALVSSLFQIEGLTSLQRKRTLIMLTFSLFWFVESFVSSIVSIIVFENSLMMIGHLSNFICLLVVFYYLHKQKQSIVLVLLVSLALTTVVMFSNFLTPGLYAEYFYLFVGPLVLVFTENKFLIFSSFIVSYLAFILPNKFYHIYPTQFFPDDYISLVLFLLFFFLVYHFKSNNSKNEKLLEIKTKELQELNQFQSQFFINISHEIKTPLTLIKGQIDKLDQIENTNIIQQKLNEQTGNIRKIVDDVIDLSKMGTNLFSLNTEVINLKSLVYKIHSSFDSLFHQKNIKFSYICTDEDCFVLADALYLERAINNLISNAYKYTDKKGEVITKLTKKGNEVFYSISDTGIGIDSDSISKIFNRFYQVNNDFNKTGGSGVGLAFTKEIVEMLEGKITVESKLNEGTTFTLTFPFKNDYKKPLIEEKTAVNSTIDSADLRTNIHKNKTILIVDDSYEMRVYLKELLQDYKCFEAENGLDALAVLKAKKIDFVLTDYMMPKMNGLEFITYMKEQNIVVPTLMLTARSDYNSKLEVLNLGINDYLSKPFEREELLIRIYNILNYYTNKNNFVIEQGITTKELKENEEWITKLNKHIVDHCGNPKLNQTDIAESFNVSKSTFYRKVKMETGLTPKEYITEIKLLRARDIAEQEKDISLKELSLKVGFLHTSYFATQYKNRFGVHPIKQLEY